MTLIVMLVWVGIYNGGPATIAGFESLESCQKAVAQVEAFYAKQASKTFISCVVLPR